MVMFKCCQGYATLCRILTNGWLIAAVVFSSLTLTSCDFVERGGSRFGLLSYGVGDVCIGDYADGVKAYGWLHTWAGVCGLLAPILGGCVILLMLLDCCCKICCSKAIWSTVLTGAELSQVFTFLFYASDACVKQVDQTQVNSVIWGGCDLGRGSIYSMIAFGCYFIGGCFLCFSPKHDPIDCQKDNAVEEKPANEENVEQAVVPDEENAAAAADPQSPPAEEVKPQVY